jgi:endoglucanase
MNFRQSLRVSALGLLLALIGPRPCPGATLPWLHAQGTRIVDASGRPVILRGVNLGGWLVEEMWMMPFETRPPEGSGFKPIKDHVTLWSTLAKRLGPTEAAGLRTALRNAWLEEPDFNRFQAAGLTCVRLPFLYDLLDEPGGYAWLDRAIDWASRRGLYVVLDLHGAPGRQSKDHHTGEENIDRLFRDPAQVLATEAVWRQVARRYRDRPEVAGYDLLNEPMGASNNAALYPVMDRLYRAVRAVDARHLVFIEDGYKGVAGMPCPARMGWTNVVFSLHSYRFDAKTAQDHLDSLARLVAQVKQRQQECQVPFYLGEFNLEPQGTPATLGQYIATVEAQGWSWSLWTWKTVMRRGSGSNSMWGWFRSPQAVKEPLNPFTDTAAEFRRKLAQVRTVNLAEHPAVGAALQHPSPVPPAQGQ